MENSFKERKEKIKEFSYVFRKNKQKVEKTKKTVSIPDNMFVICPKCQTSIIKEEYDNSLRVCPNCGYHSKLTAMERIVQIADENTFEELNADMVTNNSEEFVGYKAKLEENQVKTGMKDAVITGICEINGIKTAIAVMDSNFMMASMGSVVGEKITDLVEYSTLKKLPLIIFAASGGARMQEGIISLMQMAKTSAAIQKYKEKGLYISVLTYPTTGGVSASFASLGDITIAEPMALIGFAGRRVIENTIKEKLDDEFQTAEFLIKKGFLDMIVERKNMKQTLYTILKIHEGALK